MKLFQRLLVAPAALGLFAPVAANAAELNINGVNDYAASNARIQLNSVSSFTDVYPTDWAHKALTSMIERHDCVSAIPSGSMTRYEAASLLNSCVGSMAEANDEERRLLSEFASELAVIKGRVDAIESTVGEFEAGLFSTTTKLSGKAIFTVGAISTDKGSKEGEDTATLVEKEAVAFNYKSVWDVDTSFDGSDLLHARIASGNFTDSDPFGASGIAALESANNNADALKVKTLYYQTKVGNDFTVTAGPQVRQDDMLGVWPNAYPSDTILDVLTYAGANAAYALAEGAGAGVTYEKGEISASLLFVSESGDSADTASGGLLSRHGSDDVTAQLAWTTEGLTLAAVYTHADNGNADDSSDADDYEAWGLSGSWQPDGNSNWIPTSVSAGVGTKNVGKETKYDGTLKRGYTDIMDEFTWSIGLEWADFMSEGNTLGLGIGSAEGWRDESTYSDPMAFELWYAINVSDNITVTPALFQVERDDDYAVTGGLVKTTFSF